VLKLRNDIEKQEKKEKNHKEERKSFLLFFVCAEHDSQTRHKDIAANENEKDGNGTKIFFFGCLLKNHVLERKTFSEYNLKLWRGRDPKMA
jgi:hypothetical protein